MASTAAAGAVAAKAAAGAVMPSAVSGPQPLAFCCSRLVQFPRLADRSRHMLRAVRRLHSSSCAAQTSPQIEPQEEETVNYRQEDSIANGEVPSTAAEEVLQSYADALASGDQESLSNAKTCLQAIVDESDSFHQEVETLKVELGTAKDRFLRLNADFENFRRRSNQERVILSDSAKADGIESLLPMLDSFERAKAAVKTETEGEERIGNSYQGIYKQFVEITRGLGVSVVETIGKLFDPEIHEAIMQEHSDQYAEGVVSQEFQRGFKLGAKLLRPAMVKVSSGPGASSPPVSEASATSTSI